MQTLDPWEPIAISIRETDLFPCRRDWKMESHVADYNGLFFVRKGYGWVERDGVRFDAQPGDLFTGFAGQRVSAGHDVTRPFTVYSVNYSVRGTGSRDLRYRLELPVRLRLRKEDIRRVEMHFVSLINDFHQPAEWGKLAARGALLRLLADTMRLTDELPEEHCQGNSRPPGERTRIAFVQDYIDKHLAASMTVETLASLVNLSPVYFSALFRKCVGQPPMAYVRARRMEQAKRILLTSDESIAEVGRFVGYEDPFHFSRVFRRHTGIAPGNYRKSLDNPFV